MDVKREIDAVGAIPSRVPTGAIVVLCVWPIPVLAAALIVRHRQTSVVAVLLAGASVILGCLLVLARLRRQRLLVRLDETVREANGARAEMRRFLDSMPDAVVVLARDGRVREANDLALKLTSRSRDDVIGAFFTSMMPREQWPMLTELWQRVQGGFTEFQEPPVFESFMPDGRRVLLEATVDLPIQDLDRVVIVLREVTRQVRRAKTLEAARERFRLAFYGAPTGMALATADTATLLEVNAAFASLLGYDPATLIGMRVDDITHPDDREAEYVVVRDEHGMSEAFRMDKRYLRADGEMVWARTWVSLIDDGDAGLAIAHIEDISEQRTSKQRLEYAATHDELTGLPNRFHFLERLARELDTGAPGSVAVLFIDIDRFKIINDSLGHSVGDQVLRGMSDRLRAIVRESDVLSRYGGDEFIVMLSDVGTTMDPQEVASRIRTEIAKPLLVDGANLFVTASIGITIADQPGCTTTELLRDADAAMYRAKARGRDRVELFAAGSREAGLAALRTTDDLRRALDRGEIVPYFQPIVQLDNGRTVGFEVLARWRHPQRGLLGPDQFLPLAEETGLIGDVGASVLRSAVAKLGQWRVSSPRLADQFVSVNISLRQLLNPEFAALVGEALALGGLPANALWLEVTEATLMSDVQAATAAMRELRNLGLHVVVDDFGTGYSSLTYLKRFPVESIKIDRSFVSGLGIDAEDTTIVEAVVRLGHSLGLGVVAEGVETPLQLERLRALGCERGQGFLFGRPRPAELVEAEFSIDA
jgi:diguanylate cyclase (GGDEF)-like protein/PAS domain S-box-containing protein